MPPVVQNVFSVFFQGVFASCEERQTPAPAFAGNWLTQILASGARHVKSRLRISQSSDLWRTLSHLGTSPVVPWSCSLVVLSLPPSVPSVKSVVKRFCAFFTLGGKKLCIAAKIERPEDRGIHEIRESVPFFRVFRVFRGLNLFFGLDLVSCSLVVPPYLRYCAFT